MRSLHVGSRRLETFLSLPSSTVVSAAVENSDPVLQDYLNSTDDMEAARQLSLLMTLHAEPVLRNVICNKLKFRPNGFGDQQGQQDLEDLLAEAVLEVFSALREVKAGAGAKPIRDFRGYAAAIAFRVCSTYFRAKHPRRASLKDKVRYLLARRADFVLWKSDREEWLCGFSHSDQLAQPVRRQMPSVSLVLETRQAGHSNLEGLHLDELVVAFFKWANAPVPLASLITFLAEASGIDDESATQHDQRLEDRPDSSVGFAAEVEQRNYLDCVWREIAQLPLKQRCALLLNLTDHLGSEVLALLPGLGVASLHDIAMSLGMTVEQLAGLWSDLPLDDYAIARLLGVTRQQVINLRKSARERLMRRTKALAQGGLWTARHDKR
jgi:DNA-directed RNA polymerase specialized sigma24 family protein